jgi:hypothetical protein
MNPRTRRALLLLVLGVASTYAVAWVSDLRRPLALANNAPHIPARWARPVPAHWPAVESVHATQGRQPHVTYYFAYARDPLDGTQLQHRQEHRRSGWPFFALQRTDTFDYSFSSNTAPGLPAPTLSLERGVGLPEWARTPACHALPLRPLWTGFIANVILYSAAFAAVFFGPPEALRWRAQARHRRGECTRCRYPVGDLAICPECGRPSRS